MPFGVVIFVVVAVLASYIFSPPPIASSGSTGGRYVSGRDESWAGCGVPSHPTYQDWLDCQEWRAEKHARADAQERAP